VNIVERTCRRRRLAISPVPIFASFAVTLAGNTFSAQMFQVIQSQLAPFLRRRSEDYKAPVRVDVRNQVGRPRNTCSLRDSMDIMYIATGVGIIPICREWQRKVSSCEKASHCCKARRRRSARIILLIVT
jgi:hypothetical protein